MKSNFYGKTLAGWFIGVLFALAACGSNPPVSGTNETMGDSGDILPLDAAIREAGTRIDGRIGEGTKIALLNFNSPSNQFSEYVLDELSANLVDSGKLIVVDRKEIDLIHSEYDFQTSGEVSDSSMQEIGQMLGAQSIVSGSLIDIGGVYRLMVRVLNVQSAAVEVQYRTDIASDNRVKALLTRQTPSSRPATGLAGNNTANTPQAQNNNNVQDTSGPSGNAISGRPNIEAGGSVSIPEVTQRNSWTSVNYEKFMVLRTLDVTNWSKFALKPDGKFVVVNTNTGLKLCDVETGKVTRTIERYLTNLNAIVFSPDGQRFLTVVDRCSSNTIRITLLETGAYREFTGHTGTVRALAYSPDGKFFVSGSSSSIGRNSDNTVKMWDAETGQEVMTITGHSGSIQSVAISPDGTQIASADTGDATIKFWNVANGAMLRSISIQERGTRAFASLLAYSPNGLRLAAAVGSRIKIYDILNGREVFTLTGHGSNVSAMAFNPEGNRLISGDHGQRNNIKIWNMVNGWEIGSLDNGGGIRSLALSPDGTFLVAGGYERIKIWGEE